MGFVNKCPNCEQVKAEHLLVESLSKNIDIPISKWGDVNRDFIVGLFHTMRIHDLFGSLWIE